MNTIKTVVLALAFTAFTTGTALAQQYYPSTYSTNNYSGQGVCVNLTSDLSYNVRGTQVSQLQTFLVSQNFPGGGSWMVTGYFGGATLQAVRDFQQAQGLPVTGIVDASTRATIGQVSCGGSSYALPTTAYPYTTTVPWTSYTTGTVNPNTNYNYTYPSNGTTYTNLVNLNLTSLSQNTGAPGTQITVYGTGFDPAGNTLYFAGQAIPNISSNGTSITFIVPSYLQNGTVQLYVVDSRGTSNSLSFTLSSYPFVCGAYGYNGYNTSCGCNGYSAYTSVSTYPYAASGNCGTNPVNNTSAPTILYLNPTSGGVGTWVSIVGSGLTSSGNTVHFGNGVIANLISPDGKSVSFAVPSQITGYGSQLVGLGAYNVSVTNNLGYTSNAVSFTVTSLSGNNASATISSVNGPTSLAINQSGTWTVVINNPGGNAVTVTPNWGDANVYPYNGTIAPQSVSALGTQTLTFTHVYSVNGTYTITFTLSGNGASSISSAQVSVSGSTNYNGSPSITYFSPSSGYVGQQVTIYGSAFAPTDTINFGNGAISSAYSSNGSNITFIVPSSVGPYCASGSYCAQYLQQITPGTYNVSVMDQYGTSNIVPFTVQ